jgi:DNA-binding transcriptional LysR family regulator
MRSPVTQAEWSEAMKTATHAMSSGSPSRPIGKLARMLLAVSPSMPTTAKPSVGRAELAHYPAVIYAQGGGSTTWRFRKGANEETDTQNVSLHITAAEGVRAAVFADLGLCFASEWMFQPDLVVRSRQWQGQAGDADWSLPDLWAAFPTGRRASAKPRAFAALVENQLRRRRVAAST